MKTTTSVAALLGVSLAAGGATLLRSRAQNPTLPAQIPSTPALFPEIGPISTMRAAPVTLQETPGCLRIENTKALCPLRHTDVKANISGMVARVTVTQLFEGPRDGGPVEAIYTFPLPENAAVDDMTIKIGKEGVIKGTIKRRDEARQIYDAARAAGQTAALLDQERDNIFTQSIANLLPGEQVAVQISYVMPLKYEDGHYEFVHPLVVGPRYGAATTNQPLGVRSGHDVSVSVNLDAGLALGELAAQLHAVKIQRLGESRAQITLSPADSLPNKDFILRYTAAGSEVQEGLLAKSDGKGGGHFMLVLQPPATPRRADVTPKELVFVIDQTGSQAGAPIEKAKETMRYCLQNLNPGDTFQLLGFNTEVYPCFPKPVAATQQNLRTALAYLNPLQGSGGTDILKAADFALRQPDDPDRLRIICYMTDGYVNNDRNIVGFIRNHRGSARMFPFGIGNSVNRFLIEGMAREGKGVADIVDLRQPGKNTAQKFYQRIADPLLTEISVDWGGLSVETGEIYPKQIPDVFSAAPIVLKGRYSKAGTGEITVHGRLRGKPWERKIRVSLPSTTEPGVGEAIPTLWAREKIASLMGDVWAGDLRETPVEQVTQLALTHKLMTEYTSFVAVDERIRNLSGAQKSVVVPTELPEGVSMESESKKRSRSNYQYSGHTSGFSELASSAAPAFGRGVQFQARYQALGSFGGGMAAKASAAASTPAFLPRAATTQPRAQILKGVAPKDALSKLTAVLQAKAKAPSSFPVKIIVKLVQPPADVLARLKALGFVPGPELMSGLELHGSIDESKLKALAALTFVQAIREDRPTT